MKVKLYAVLDNCSGVYDGPVPANTDGLALRNFEDMCKNPQSPMSKHPGDFSLPRDRDWETPEQLSSTA